MHEKTSHLLTSKIPQISLAAHQAENIKRGLVLQVVFLWMTIAGKRAWHAGIPAAGDPAENEDSQPSLPSESRSRDQDPADAPVSYRRALWECIESPGGPHVTRARIFLLADTGSGH